MAGDLLWNNGSPPSDGGTVESDGVGKLFESVDQATFGDCAIALVEVGGAEVDIGATVLEKVPDDDED